MKRLSAIFLLFVTVAASATERPATTTSGASAALAFGVYRVLPEYRAATSASKKTAENKVGAFSVVAAKNPITYVKPNSVLRNTVTGKLAIVSGRISVLTNNPSALTQATSDLGLKAITRVDNDRLQFLQAKSGSNMLELKKKLEALDGVVEVRLDIIEDKLKPQ